MAALATPLGRSTAANWKEALAESTTGTDNREGGVDARNDVRGRQCAALDVSSHEVGDTSERFWWLIHIRLGASMPSSPRPCVSTRAVRPASASRLARTS